ncbi:hypothetical protein GWN26_14650 [Candidatus Saccharibacteria bacterium]|nr:hypothetical protein [Candidatus Saccharibacteria bacterium]NIV04030.1 hypothetical protein [Calditrichia bacterium]NIS38083.1 hypothetical protein [Candidatus Saccharibacteria bacterium]NIV73015.1 hypothetical protein [Calditrichia bacterium]NIW00285.1 hypothetical protein [Candidatus Saccharibacteria bacterium]
MKGVIIEVGKFIILSIVGGLIIFAVVSFVATPAMITRYIITNSPQGDPNFLYYGLQAGLIAAIIIFVVQFLFRTLSEA